MKTTTTSRPAPRTASLAAPGGTGLGNNLAGNRRRSRRRRISAGSLLPGGTSLTLVVIWEALTRSGALPLEVSRPTQIARWLFDQAGKPGLWEAIAHTLEHTLLGLLFGSLAGIVLGLIMGEIAVVQRVFQSSLEFLRPIPVLIYLPLLILVFGATAKTAILLVAIGAVWPMLYQTMYGVRAVDALLTDTGRAFGLSRRQRLMSITVPSISPYLATGVRISLSIALVVSVAIELIAGVAGLGWSLTLAETAGDYPALYGIAVVSGILSLLMNAIALAAEKRVLHWHVSNRTVKV